MLDTALCKSNLTIESSGLLIVYIQNIVPMFPPEKMEQALDI
jgi:hypothetical protein